LIIVREITHLAVKAFQEGTVRGFATKILKSKEQKAKNKKQKTSMIMRSHHFAAINN
jgi:hypothetical protein